MTPCCDGADAERDTLAFLAAAWAGDADGIGAVLANSNVPVMTGMLAGMLYEALRDHGTDPAGWVAAQQARARSELGGLPGG